MRGQFRVEKPGEVEMTLTVTMTVRDWQALKDDLGTKYPSWKLGAMIGELIYKAHHAITSTDETKP